MFGLLLVNPRTFTIDPADLRSFIAARPAIQFDILSTDRCVFGQYLRARYGWGSWAGIHQGVVGGVRVPLPVWSPRLQRVLYMEQRVWRGAEVLPVFDSVLAEYGIVVDACAATSTDALDTPSSMPQPTWRDRFAAALNQVCDALHTAWHAMMDAFLSSETLAAAPTDLPTEDEVANAVIIAPAVRARRMFVTALDGMPRDHQVADRRPAVAHRVE